VLGYTRPDGDNLLVSGGGIVRTSLAGIQQALLIRGSGYDAALGAPDGISEVVNGPDGVELVSNAGGIVRRLPVPGATAKLGGCTPVRWWNATTALVSCISSTVIASPRLWLVPVSGSAPHALTAVRNGRDGDYGDIDAWRFRSTLYVQALGACGVRYIGKQTASGTVAPVNVPGSAGNNVVVATSGNRMLVQEFSECSPASSVVWFNPATGTASDVLLAPKGGDGVLSVIAYDRNGEQPSDLQ
jgi:TolB protein